MFHDQELVTKLLTELVEWGPFIHAENSQSIYIGFEDLPQEMTHKLRVSDHPERDRYGYKWQLRLDGIPPKSQQKTWSKYFDDPDTLITAFSRYYNKIQTSEEIVSGHTNTWP